MLLDSRCLSSIAAVALAGCGCGVFDANVYLTTEWIRRGLASVTVGIEMINVGARYPGVVVHQPSMI
jgi:hypothetical protein